MRQLVAKPVANKASVPVLQSGLDDFRIAFTFHSVCVAAVCCMLLERVNVCWILVDGTFESLDITDLSTPPDLPEVMKPQDSTSHVAD